MKTDTIIRTVVLALALFNQFMLIKGCPILPIEEESVNELISAGFTLVTVVLAWWKNNSFTPEAIEADKYLEELRRKGD